MSPVPLSVQQAPEGVFHRAGHGGKDVSLHGRQVENILSLK